MVETLLTIQEWWKRNKAEFGWASSTGPSPFLKFKVDDGRRAGHNQKTTAKNGSSGRAARELVINSSGGLITKGHPIGATGIAQACELWWQLTGRAEKVFGPGRQVALNQNSGRLFAMQHNYGFNGGACMLLYGSPEDEDTTRTRARL